MSEREFLDSVHFYVKMQPICGFYHSIGWSLGRNKEETMSWTPGFACLCSLSVDAVQPAASTLLLPELKWIFSSLCHFAMYFVTETKKVNNTETFVIIHCLQKSQIPPVLKEYVYWRLTPVCDIRLLINNTSLETDKKHLFTLTWHRHDNQTKKGPGHAWPPYPNSASYTLPRIKPIFSWS